LKKLVLTSCAVMSLCIGSSVYAADMPMKSAPQAAPIPTAYNWTGLYLGAHVGGGVPHTQATTTSTNINFPTTGALLAPFDQGGIVGGGQAGFNWQFAPQWVIGVEGEYSKTGIHGTTSEPSPGVPGRTISTFHDIDNIASVSGRLGYAFNNVLLYGKGGVAWADFSNRSSSVGAGALVLCCTVGSDTREGWLAGGGIEYGFAPNWSAKIEYNYLDFGTTATTAVNTVTGEVNTRNAVAHIHIAKFGVNYRFGWLGQ
jgi:outer membrane immunogenic protein